MTDITLIEPLTPAEADARDRLEETIRSSFYSMAIALRTIKEQRLYRDFGTFDAYCRARLNIGDIRARQLISAVVFAEQVQQQTGVALPNEAVVRELKKYGDNAATLAVAAAASGELTAPGVQKVAQELGVDPVQPTPPSTATDAAKQKVYETKCAPLIQWMNAGTLTPKAALALWDTLQTCRPIVRGDMLRLGIRNESVIRYLNDRSLTEGYQEIVATKYLQFAEASIEIAKATPAQVREFFEERRKEHLRRAAAEKDAAKKVQEVVLTLWLNDPDRSAKMLRTMLGDRNAAQISRLILNQTQPVNSLTASAVF